jgi:chromosome segregation ATPase
MSSVDIVDAHDWKQHAIAIEKSLSTERGKTKRAEKMLRKLRTERDLLRKKVDMLQCQIEEYSVALGSSTQDCSRLINQCRGLSETNLALAKDIQKSKSMVETLEAVIMMLFTHLSAKEVSLTHHRLKGRRPLNEDKANLSA